VAFVFGDQFNYATLSDRWTLDVGAGYPAIGVGTGRSGTNAMRQPFNNFFTATTPAERAFGANYSQLVAGFWLTDRSYHDAQYQTIFQTADGASYQVRLIRLYNLGPGTNGLVRVEWGASFEEIPAFALALGTAYYIEVKVVHHASAGSIEVRVDGVTVYTKTGINTARSGHAYANKVWCLGALSLGTGIMDMDDLYVVDDTGGADNDFLGDVYQRAPVANTLYWQQVQRDGLTPIYSAEGFASGRINNVDTFRVNNDGKVLLYARNAGPPSSVITVRLPRFGTEVTRTLLAGEHAFLGPFAPSRFSVWGAGVLEVEFSSVTGLSVAFLRT
jgi:hypothetical protein